VEEEQSRPPVGSAVDKPRREPREAQPSVDVSKLVECEKCGAAVANEAKHQRWHRIKIGREATSANNRAARKK
jgi:hypothetical protein